MTRTLTLAMLLLFHSAMPSFAQERSEDVRLKGRGWGRGIAFFWNTTDDATRRMIR